MSVARTERPESQRIHSIYLSAEEEQAVRRLAAANGTSVNFVVRVAVRTLLGLPAAQLTTKTD